MSQPRILIACIGNIFLGDDAFGVEVARAMAARSILVLAGREDDLPQHLRYKRHETVEPVL